MLFCAILNVIMIKGATLMTQYHNIPPVYDKNSRILILGSFPSVKSREAQFFYGHPQNRFWKVMSAVLSCDLPVTVQQKKLMLLSHNIAVWDVIGSCEITGSSDATISSVVPNDIAGLVAETSVTRIFANGATSYNMYKRYCREISYPVAVTYGNITLLCVLYQMVKSYKYRLFFIDDCLDFFGVCFHIEKLTCLFKPALKILQP